jgi:drug/metabolite transporter (DMT)-like permease
MPGQARDDISLEAAHLGGLQRNTRRAGTNEGDGGSFALALDLHHGNPIATPPSSPSPKWDTRLPSPPCLCFSGAAPVPDDSAGEAGILVNSSKLLTGIILTVLAGMVFSVMDATGKTLTTLMPVIQVVWGRYFVQTILVSSYLGATSGRRFLRARRPVLQCVRGATLLGATLMMYIALARVPLADCTAVMFFSPILVTVFSVIFLKERIGLHRIAAVVAGFVGVVLIVRPGSAGFDPFLLLPLVASVLNAAYLMLTRQLAGSEDAAATVFHTTATGAVVLTLLVIPVWQTPSLGVAGLMVFIGSIGAVGHTLLINAFRHAPASLLSPFLYSQMLFATAISLFWFGDGLHETTLTGMAVLIGSGLYIWWRENRDKRALRALRG